MTVIKAVFAKRLRGGATFNNHKSQLENFQPQEYNHHHYDHSSISGERKTWKIHTGKFLSNEEDSF